MSLEKEFVNVYTKFQLQFYKKIFQRFASSETSLTTIEAFSAETIHALGRPTVNEFSRFAQISAPNATYKVNSLIKKGYLNKVRSEDDKREYYLEVTEKFFAYYAISADYMSEVMKRLRERFPPEDIEKLEEMLHAMAEELMPEVRLDAAANEL